MREHRAPCGGSSLLFYEIPVTRSDGGGSIRPDPEAEVSDSEPVWRQSGSLSQFASSQREVARQDCLGPLFWLECGVAWCKRKNRIISAEASGPWVSV